MSAADNVIAIASQQTGKKYKLGTQGPTLFDCSGLVDYAFRQAGQYGLIGGARKRAAGYARWFAKQHQFTKDASQARRGDLYVFAEPGKRISHIGIALGGGKVLSALVNPYGVRETNATGLHDAKGGPLPVFGVCLVAYPDEPLRTGTDSPGSMQPGDPEGSVNPGGGVLTSGPFPTQDFQLVHLRRSVFLRAWPGSVAPVIRRVAAGGRIQTGHGRTGGLWAMEDGSRGSWWFPVLEVNGKSIEPELWVPNGELKDPSTQPDIPADSQPSSSGRSR